jgi:hypothetical protein
MTVEWRGSRVWMADGWDYDGLGFVGTAVTSAAVEDGGLVGAGVATE